MKRFRWSAIAALLAAAAVVGSARTSAAVLGDAYSVSKAAGGVPFDGSVLIKRKLPPGFYAVTSNGNVSNASTTQVAYVECVFDTSQEVLANFAVSDGVAPVALSPGVPGSVTWSLTTTVEVLGDGGTIGVSCFNFGPASSSDLKAWWPSLVAVKVGNVVHKLVP